MKIAPLCLCCAGLLLAGCGKKDPPVLAPVHGQVWYQGKPLAGGTVVFTPDVQRGGAGPQAWARVGDDGTFVLSTDGKPGAAPGWHRITIAPAGTATDLPARYRDPQQAEQLFEVKSDKANDCLLRLD